MFFFSNIERNSNLLVLMIIYSDENNIIYKFLNMLLNILKCRSEQHCHWFYITSHSFINPICLRPLFVLFFRSLIFISFYRYKNLHVQTKLFYFFLKQINHYYYCTVLLKKTVLCNFLMLDEYDQSNLI